MLNLKVKVNVNVNAHVAVTVTVNIKVKAKVDANVNVDVMFRKNKFGGGATKFLFSNSIGFLEPFRSPPIYSPPVIVGRQ